MTGHTLEEWDGIEEHCGSELAAEFEAEYGPQPPPGPVAVRQRVMSGKAKACDTSG